MKKEFSVINVIKFAGAYMAFIIGSGFATGQEIMQFFTGFGYYSVGAVLVSMAIFAWVGASVMGVGYDHRGIENHSTYVHFCGKYLGTFFEYFIPLFLFAVVVIMISGAGATLNEYYGLNYYVGALLMAAMVLAAFILGLSKLIGIVGMIGPVIIIFSMVIGFITLAGNMDGLAAAGEAMKNVTVPTAAKFWWLGGMLYAAYNLVGAVIFFTALGKSAASKKEAVAGGITGGVVLMLATLVMNLALLSDIEVASTLAIPTLHFAKDISPALGVIFSIILICGIFSTAAPMMWTVCNKIAGEGTRKSRIIAVVVNIIAFFCGLLPFGVLVGTVYPFTGYLGILMFVCILYKQITGRFKESAVRNDSDEVKAAEKRERA